MVYSKWRTVAGPVRLIHVKALGPVDRRTSDRSSVVEHRAGEEVRGGVGHARRRPYHLATLDRHGGRGFVAVKVGPVEGGRGKGGGAPARLPGAHHPAWSRRHESIHQSDLKKCMNAGRPPVITPPATPSTAQFYPVLTHHLFLTGSAGVMATEGKQGRRPRIGEHPWKGGASVGNPPPPSSGQSPKEKGQSTSVRVQR